MIYDKLNTIQPEILANFIKNEYPQTAAYLLNKLDSELAGKVTELLPQNYMIEVLMRLSRMEIVTERTAEIVEKNIEKEFDNFLESQSGKMFNLKNLINFTSITNRELILTCIKERNLELYTFLSGTGTLYNDIIAFPDEMIETIIENCDKELLLKALIGQPTEVIKKFVEYIPELIDLTYEKLIENQFKFEKEFKKVIGGNK